VLPRSGGTRKEPHPIRSPKRVDHRSDVWSLGVLLYRCVTGELGSAGGERPAPPATVADTVHAGPAQPAQAELAETVAAPTPSAR
jgi:serine/threonine protein kinase